jgi:hypothetical protein
MGKWRLKWPILAGIFLLTIFSIAGYFYINNRISQNGQSQTQSKSTGSFTQKTAYSIVDTGQSKCFDNSNFIECQDQDSSEKLFSFSGQDGNYSQNEHSYTDNKDGTVTDNITGLIWQQSADTNNDGTLDDTDKMNQSDAANYCADLKLAGKSDWRLPDIKTLYSLMSFYGTDISSQTSSIPYINTDFFDFAYGEERTINSQWATSTIYESTVMNEQEAMFGLNLADGRIKGYPVTNDFFVKCVRGNTEYGKNDFIDNGNKTITDNATGLIWQQVDSQEGIGWEDALGYCKDADTAGYSDWRLPNAKELQSIVDYSRSPETTNSAAISSIFQASEFTSEAGVTDWGYYCTSTTHEKNDGTGSYAVYISFGRAWGYMNNQWLDVHGAGAQRSDPKIALDLDNLPNDPQNSFTIIDEAITHGPQGDLLRSLNYVRCVRGQSGTYNGDIPDTTPPSTELYKTNPQTDIQSNSDNTKQDDTQPDRQTPPLEAINACNEKSEDRVCSFTTPEATITGICQYIDDLLACVPG